MTAENVSSISAADSGDKGTGGFDAEREKKKAPQPKRMRNKVEPAPEGILKKETAVNIGSISASDD